jgi:hypothetical protein
MRLAARLNADGVQREALLVCLEPAPEAGEGAAGGKGGAAVRAELAAVRKAGD